MTEIYDRREVLKLAGGLLVGGWLTGRKVFGDDGPHPVKTMGCVIGNLQAAHAGAELLIGGGNAVDAVLAAALAAGVVDAQNCGIGGYGGVMVVALPGGKKVTAIDFNTMAPAAAREDMFPLDDKGEVKGKIDSHGWLAAGVPGILAGVQLALERYGTRPFRAIVRPAIDAARNGFEVSSGFATATRHTRAQLLKDPASARLLLDRDEPLKRGARFRNPELADVLQTLAERNSVDSFYQGDIAERIAAAFKKHGGLVTREDLAAYRAREVEPYALDWRGYSMRTAPLTAGGLSLLQALAVLKALEWDKRAAKDPDTLRAQIETLRIAWNDRLKLLGDPEKVKVPVQELLSAATAEKSAARVKEALQKGEPVALPTPAGPKAQGTTHLCAVDHQGMMAALTLTHGGSFGALVTVEGLGLTLGHGMSRFDPRPGRANSVGPRKRPLHNMCPTIVLRDGLPVLTLGGTGGRKIPNALFHVLSRYIGQGTSLDEAIAGPRTHTVGNLTVTLEPQWPDADAEYLKKIGYTVDRGSSATVHAVTFDPKSGDMHHAAR